MGAEFWVQFIVAVITVLAAIISVLSLPTRKLKLTCGSVFLALGVLWVLLLRDQIANAKQTSNQLQGTLARIGDLQLKLGTSQEQLENAQQVNNHLQQQLIEASKTIARLSNETLKMATGGDSFCVASLIAPFNRTEKPLLVVMHAGKYPLYGLTVKLFDAKLAAAAMQNRGVKETIPDTSRQLNIGSLDLGSGISIDLGSLEGDAARRFTLFFHARNGDWIEVLVIRRVNERWIQAIKVYKSEYRKTEPQPYERDLYSRVDSEYPRENGKVNWNIGYEPEGCTLPTGEKCP